MRQNQLSSFFGRVKRSNLFCEGRLARHRPRPTFTSSPSSAAIFIRRPRGHCDCETVSNRRSWAGISTRCFVREGEREGDLDSFSSLSSLTYLHMVDISRLTARANSEALFETIKAEVFCRRRREERDLHRRRSFSCFSLALCRPPLAFRAVSRSLELRRTASPRRHFSPNRIVLAE